MEDSSDVTSVGLAALFDAIKEERRVRLNLYELDRAVGNGWFHLYTIYDMMEDVGWGLKDWTKTLLAETNVRLQSCFHRPRRIVTSVSGGDGLRCADMAAFMIYLERLGFDIDPEPLVEKLLPIVRKLSMVTSSELHVLWYAQERHKMQSVEICVPGYRGPDFERSRIEEYKTRRGYKVHAYFDDDEIQMLTVTAPRYRYRREPQPVTCPICRFTYCKGSPEDTILHRREHKKWLAILEPSPDPRFLEALDHETDPELVMANSPRWRQKAMYMRALAFKREEGYDFIQWAEKHDDDSIASRPHGFMFNDDTGVFGRGAIIGGCAFRWREWTNAPHGWALQWIWIVPKARRQGVLTRRWPAFRERFGQFHIEGPLSKAMHAFATKHGALPPKPDDEAEEE